MYQVLIEYMSLFLSYEVRLIVYDDDAKGINISRLFFFANNTILLILINFLDGCVSILYKDLPNKVFVWYVLSYKVSNR